MEQLHLQLSDLRFLAPELTLVVSAIVLSVLDLALRKQVNRNILGWLALAAVALSALFVAYDMNPEQPVQLLQQSYRIDDFANLMKLVFLIGTGLVLFTGLGFVKEEHIAHKGEFYYLLLPAALGGMIMASSGDLVTLYVGLELISITSYILVGLNKKSLRSNEAAFKYVVLGAISSAIVLYGMSFLYGMTGTTNLTEMSAALARDFDSFEALAYLAFFLLLAGFGFKIAAAPFHNWAPDVYQGAPTPVTAFLAVVSKAAAFAILFRVMYAVFGSDDMRGTALFHDAFAAIMVVAAAAMVVGNFVALRQKNIKRLLAYSGIANSGYLLVPIGTQLSSGHLSNFTEFAFYLIAYLFMNIGAFAVLMAVERSTGSEEAEAFAGLYYRAPWTAAAMVVLLLSLAGIPVTGGFFGKLYIILGTLTGHHYWLAGLMIATSVVSFYYYFAIMRQMFMRSDGGGDVRVGVPLGVTIGVCAIVTVLLGIFPQTVVGFIERIFTLQQDLFMLP